MTNAIEVQGISKRYLLGEGGLSRLLRRSGDQEAFWALRDISFAIREHESVGIVGSNGAGKSTLLKILSRVTAPTAGRAQVRGRMGTILEVGTGFHPELTGRENVYLSGAILGMSQREIDRRFDEIVDFAGVETFVDTPVKRYSSGMYVRLAFAVAAHLDPDILIVDEVLAVGDVGFQKKCLAKMGSSIRDDGRTIIFVSHNLQAIRSLCSRGILLDRGSLIADGSIADVLSTYATTQKASFDVRKQALGNRLNRTRGRARISAFSISSPGRSEDPGWSFRTGDTVDFKISYEILEAVESLELVLSFALAGTEQLVSSLRETLLHGPCQKGDSGTVCIEIPKLPFRPGELALTVGLGSNGFVFFEDIIDANVNLPHLMVESIDDDLFGRGGLVALDYRVDHAVSRCVADVVDTAGGLRP